MSKSLTEVAKAVLMKESAGIPEVHPMDAGDPFRDAKSLTPNAATLRPGSRSVDPTKSLGSATKLADPVIQPNGADGDNLGAAAAGAVKTDNSAPKKSAKPAEPVKKLAMAEEMEDDSEVVAEGSHASKPVKKDMADAIANFKGKITKGETKKAKGLKEEEINEEEINEEEELSEDFEISEELEAFVHAMIEEGYDEDQIAEAIEENFEIVEEEINEEELAEDYEVDMSEDIEALFAGEELSEEFKEKAKTIFESAVKAKLAEEIAIIEEAYAATLEEQLEQIEEELSSNVDDYLNYVVEQWTAENEVAIEAGLRAELTEDFIAGLHNLFVEHYIDIPSEKVNVIEELGSKVEELESKLNEEIERNVALNRMLNESQTNEILFSACEGLTDTQAEKLKSLAEGIEYASAEEYAQKISILKENYFSTSVKSNNVLDSVDGADDNRSMISEELSGPMAKYVNALGKTLPR